MEINHVVIVGGGPVGSFTAVLIRKLGLPVTVYEKRQSFTRAINVKVKKHLLKRVQDVCDEIGMADSYFKELNKQLGKQKHKILLKTLEERFKQEAEEGGAKYVVKEVKDFGDVYERHKSSQPLILDCSGRNSTLRTCIFGDDKANIKSLELDSVLYINLNASIADTNVSLYPAMENVKHIKLARLLASKQDDGSTQITIVACVNKELSEIYDKNFDNTNKNPLKPFTNSNAYIPDEIFQSISALISPLILEGSRIDLQSVTVKKINITCGYAIQRSQGRFVCLGDAAVHLAYFQSLNVGLSHALDFFATLAKYCKTEGVVTDRFVLRSLVFNQTEFREDYVLDHFKAQNVHLNPTQVLKTKNKAVFLVVTKMMWYGCYSYDITNKTTKQLTGVLGIYKNQIPTVLEKLNEQLSSGEPDVTKRVIREFTNDVKMLLFEVVAGAVDVYATKRKDNYLVITKALWFGCYWYDLASHKVQRLTDMSGTAESEIPNVLGKLNKKLCDWEHILNEYETKRQAGIDQEVRANRSTQSQYDFAADMVWLHSLSPLTLPGIYSHILRGYAIHQGDQEYFSKCLKALRENAVDLGNGTLSPEIVISNTVQKLGKLSEEFDTKELFKNIDRCQQLVCSPSEQLKSMKMLMISTTKRERRVLDLLTNGRIKLDFVTACLIHLLKDIKCGEGFDDEFGSEFVDEDENFLLL